MLTLVSSLSNTEGRVTSDLLSRRKASNIKHHQRLVEEKNLTRK